MLSQQQLFEFNFSFNENKADKFIVSTNLYLVRNILLQQLFNGNTIFIPIIKYNN